MKGLGILLMAAPEAGEEGGGMQTLIMFGAIFLVFYLFMIRPQMKKQKQEKGFASELKKGDKGYIDGYVRSADDRGYAVVVVGEVVEYCSLHKLKVIQ